MNGMVLSRTGLLLLIAVMLFAQLRFFQAAAYSVQLLPGDINGDGTVDIFDAITIAGKFGTTPQSPGWDPNADVNQDNIVDILDTVLLAKSFGNSATPLEQKAFEEGSLTIHGVMDYSDFIKWIEPAFVNEFPWAAGMINYVGKSPSDLSTQALNEYLAGHVQADVLINTLGSLMPALQGGVAENWTNPIISLMNYSTGTYDPTGQWDPGYGIPIVIVYNTDLVNSSMVPTNWQNLTDSFWNGKIAIDEPKTLNVAAALFAHLYPLLGNASWTMLMQGLAANREPIRTYSAGDSYTDVATGQASSGVALINDYMSGVHQTPPVHVSIAPLQPVTFLPIPSVLCANAPHPNFGKLFLEWFASSSGQHAIANTGRCPMHFPTAVDTILKDVLPPEVTSMTGAATNNLDYYVNPSKWSDTYTSIFG